jgi:hypothetical protein
MAAWRCDGKHRDGVIGRKLTARLHRDGVVGGLAITVPEVRWYSRWPGHLLPISRNRLMSSRVTEGSPRHSDLALTAFTPVRCSNA